MCGEVREQMAKMDQHQPNQSDRQKTLDPFEADQLILRYIIDKLERDTWDSPNLSVSIENQGELVRAQNRLAHHLRQCLKTRTDALAEVSDDQPKRQ